MKATIDAQGVLIVKAETPLESYALRQWSADAFVLIDDQQRKESAYVRGSKIIFDASPEAGG